MKKEKQISVGFRIYPSDWENLKKAKEKNNMPWSVFIPELLDGYSKNGEKNGKK